MPTPKKKVKKPKENSDGKPNVNIKQEPEELKPLTAYVDDRLELIRQVFSCVKPKEIKYLLPDFLEGKSNDVIKERCLDELLGISTKRLHSIIANTKCPTDTESSSENSDVENIEEHISLDEISSDSDVDDKRTSKRNKKDVNKQSEDKKGEPKSEKEMTVLELLELQARARAIRSQLAQEPVTKIEIDSDHDGEDGRHGDIDTDDEGRQTETIISVKNGNQLKLENNAQQQTKRVRLKRNFRIRKVGDDEEDEQDASSNPPEHSREKSSEPTVEVVDLVDKIPEPVPVENSAPEAEKSEAITEKEPPSDDALPEAVATETTVEKAEAVPVENELSAKDASEDATNAPEQNSDRESSPEVIPVEASPETLCISSDSEEERRAKERASIFVPNIEELDRQAKKPPTPEPEKPAEDTEPEEGEISEEEEVPPESVEQTPAGEAQSEDVENKDGSVDSSKVSEPNAATEEMTQIDPTDDENRPAAEDGGPGEVEQPEAKSTEIQTLSSSSDESESESDTSSDDSPEEEEAKKEPPKPDNFAPDDEDIVEIHDSGDENLLLEDKPPEEEAKSWNSRWLKSNRVAKVMAESRLGNKVREKLKKKKQIQLAEQQETEAPETAQPSPKPAEPVVELPANVELGSVEHYRELVAQQESRE